MKILTTHCQNHPESMHFTIFYLFINSVHKNIENWVIIDYRILITYHSIASSSPVPLTAEVLKI